MLKLSDSTKVFLKKGLGMSEKDCVNYSWPSIKLNDKVFLDPRVPARGNVILSSGRIVDLANLEKRLKKILRNKPDCLKGKSPLNQHP